MSVPGQIVEKRVHQFYAQAFEENLALKDLAPVFPDAKPSAHELYVPRNGTGSLYIYPFGAVVTQDVPPDRRDAEIARLLRARPNLTTKVVLEDYSVVEDPAAQTGISAGTLTVDRLTTQRAGIVALTVAQSAAMEYYEQIVDDLTLRTRQLVERLEERGSVPLRTGGLHRFIGQAISIRTEVLSVLHLLDKPDATWEDPAMDRIYADLRAEFDLADRYDALESKLRSIQEALELVLDVARDRRLILLEVFVALLILLEVVMGLIKLV